MSREQIEEMAKELTTYEKKLCERLPKDKCLLTSAVHVQVSCDYCKIAEFLVNAGYRKQSVGEWISNRQTDEFICSLCGAIAPVDCLKEAFYESKFCPNCGARMKGGVG